MLKIRPAKLEDAKAVSDMIRKTLWISNLQDYGSENIKRVVENMSPEQMRENFTARFTLVAELDAIIVGTAAHERGIVKTVFVDPEHQRAGIGRRLMDEIIGHSTRRREPHLDVRSSIIAERFYQQLGFEPLKELWEGDERTILMRRTGG